MARLKAQVMLIDGAPCRYRRFCKYNAFDDRVLRLLGSGRQYCEKDRRRVLRQMGFDMGRPVKRIRDGFELLYTQEVPHGETGDAARDQGVFPPWPEG